MGKNRYCASKNYYFPSFTALSQNTRIRLPTLKKQVKIALQPRFSIRTKPSVLLSDCLARRGRDNLRLCKEEQRSPNDRKEVQLAL